MRRLISSILFLSSIFPYAQDIEAMQNNLHETMQEIRSQKMSVSDAQNHLRKCSDSGNLYCTQTLAAWHFQTREYSKAKPLFEKAYIETEKQDLQLHSLPAYYLGVMYRDGLGVEKNISKAKDYLSDCHQKGFSRCSTELHRLYNPSWLHKQLFNPILD